MAHRCLRTAAPAMLSRASALAPLQRIACASSVASVASRACSARFASSIPVIFLKDTDWGNAGLRMDVRRGFARNFLVPNRIAVYATSENSSQFERAVGDSEFAELKARREVLRRLRKRYNRIQLQFERETDELGELKEPMSEKDVMDYMRTNYGVMLADDSFDFEGKLPARTPGRYRFRIQIEPGVWVPKDLVIRQQRVKFFDIEDSDDEAIREQNA